MPGRRPDMRVSRSPRWAYGAFAWLIVFIASHVVLVLFPGDDPTGDGPWGMTAYVIFSTGEFWAGIGINSYFFVGAILLVAATISYLDDRG